jgi:hypothetical protein
MSGEKTVPMSLRLSHELLQRLEETARVLGVKKHTLAQDAIKAAVEAIERNGYKLVIPIEFEVTSVAVPKASSPSPSPSHRDQRQDDRAPAKKKTA